MCRECKGQRLKKGALAVTVGDKNIYEVTAMSIERTSANLWSSLELYKDAADDRRIRY